MGGTDKLLEPVNGAPLLQVLASRALIVGPTFVTVPSLTHRRRFVLPQAARVVAVTGQMSDSIRAGVAALPDTATGVIILPADMPDITTEDIAAIKAEPDTGASLVQATTADGQPGHPTYFAASFFGALKALGGDHGARDILQANAHLIHSVPLQGNRARLDLDTLEDWAAWRAR